MSDKHTLSESDICDRYITPAMHKAGWKPAQIRREYSFTDGQVMVRGNLAKRGKRKRADYLLFYQPNLALAVIEAKDNKFGPGHGMQQAMGYAESLDVPFVFSSNGDAFVFHDRTGQSEPTESLIALEDFPSPEELWKRYCLWKGLNEQQSALSTSAYHDDGDGKEPRYYQRIAIQRTVEAVALGERRILLVMATGTGKTYTAFQIIWRLWKSRKARRILFLVDRNVLADQTKQDDFKPFGDAMVKVKNRTVEKSHEIYLALYQAVTGTEEVRNIYKQFSPSFFDLVVIDECHRGSAREQSNWRDILTYFSQATHLGLTATPKESKDVSTHHYFGDPVYEYSLKQGIQDGFLAPYKVVRIDIDKDLQGWRPQKGMKDDLGQEIEDRIYNQQDMDKTLVLNQRTKLVASKIMDYLATVDPYGKSIVFCENIDHAERMRRALINLVNRRMPKEKGRANRFVVRITGDSKEGKAKLDDFMHAEKRYPVIATTSKLLSTGVNIKTCKLVVLDQRLQSMIEFKQIIGRGTRIHEKAGKLWFSIMDFKKATELFADPAFDGEPIIIYEPSEGDPPNPPDDPETEGEVIEDPKPKGKPYVVSGVKVSVAAERVQYYGNDGKLITESLKDYTRDALRKNYSSLDDFVRKWSATDKKQAILEELESQGVLLKALEEEVSPDFDAFDVICHVAYDRPPLTRQERANNVKKRDVYTRYGEQARAVLAALLDKYADEGIVAVEDPKVLRLDPFRQMGAPTQIAKWFGGGKNYKKAIRQLGQELYKDVG